MGNFSLSEAITYSTVLIRCKYANGLRGSGTGFIINFCVNKEKNTAVPALVTNNHVVENSVETVFEFCRADETGNPIDTKPYSLIYNGNDWIHHPDKDVDLCCLLLGRALKILNEKQVDVFYVPLDTSFIPTQEQLDGLTAMEEVVMVGYPIGLSDTYNHKPILRRGITSTHPKNDYCGKKETLLDMACYPGSSGSPIFIMNQGTYATPSGITLGTRVHFLGVLYGGHEFNAQGVLTLTNLPNVPVPVTRIPINLGIMIKAERILEFEHYIKRLTGE